MKILFTILCAILTLCLCENDRCSKTSCENESKNLYKIDKWIPLNDLNYIPTFGLGVWKIPNGEDTINAVTWALNSGYRHIDTAARYGNEESVGVAINASEIPRKEIYVTTKLYDDSHGYNETLEAFYKSLKRLGLDYIDLYLIHSPMNGKILSTFEAMLELKRKKLVRSIGVSNFGIHHLAELQKFFNVVPAVNQIEVHPYLQERDLVKYCKENNIVVQAYSPLANGQKLGETSLGELAKKYQRSPAVVLIRWCLEKGYVCIPKSSNKKRIEENITAFEFQLKKEDMEFLDTLDGLTMHVKKVHGCYSLSGSKTMIFKDLCSSLYSRVFLRSKRSVFLHHLDKDIMNVDTLLLYTCLF